jgi:triosephosphate isomerase
VNAKRTIDSVEVSGRRVLLRVDFNVPLRDGVIADDRRITEVVPTIESLRARGARTIVVTHMGRPRGQVVDSLRVTPVARRLSELLACDVPVAEDVAGPHARALVGRMSDGDVVMLENVRFDAREEANDPSLASELAALADVYCNEAFGTAHRAHASTVGVAQLLPAVAGRLMDRELTVLSGVLNNPRGPVVSIVGGSKISTKIGVIRHLIDRVDTLWVGGAMACTFYRALGQETGTSLVEEDQVQVAAELLARDGHGGDLRLPVDLVVVPTPVAGAPTEVVSWKDIPPDRMVVDVGPDTVLEMSRDCARARTVVWNGPLGIYEIDDFAQGTRALARSIVEGDAFTVIGGGDLGAAVEDAGVADRFSHISTGGGATLEFLEGRQLPCVVALQDAEGQLPATPATPRRPLVAGNWKMNTTVPEGIQLVRRILGRHREPGVQVLLLPPFTHLWPLHNEIGSGPIELGAQDVFWEDSGAFTGEISPAQLSGWCRWVLVGHSERRHVMGESDDHINRKVRAALKHRELSVLLAVGETLDQREGGSTMPVVHAQLEAALSGVAGKDLGRCVIAYEPVWAIGTGRTATAEQAQEVCAALRVAITSLYSTEISGAIRILYGGSVTPANAAELFAQPDIDGALVGGASLKSDDFMAIAHAAVPVVAGAR